MQQEMSHAASRILLPWLSGCKNPAEAELRVSLFLYTLWEIALSSKQSTEIWQQFRFFNRAKVDLLFGMFF